MKHIRILLLALPLLFMACEEDTISNNILAYDGPNDTGPNMPVGTHEFAVRFTATELSEHIGKNLTEVSFFIGDAPNGLQVIVYGEGTDSSPGQVLDAININGIITRQRNKQLLSKPIEITGEDIWISMRVTLNQTQQSIGCDAGPGKANGDWLFRADDQQWLPFSERTNDNINWNIRGFVE